MRAIVCCNCPGIPLAAKATCRVVTKAAAPIVWFGKNRISVLLSLVPQGSEIYQHLMACAKTTNKFAYLFEWNVDGTLLKRYNLLSGKEIK